jgi:hypothetical protein
VAPANRQTFIGGSDARIIWAMTPEDLSSNLIVQLGLATEDLKSAPV